MISVIQRVRHASVKVADKTVGQIEQGLCVLVAVEKGDNLAQVEKMSKKIIHYRVFSDENGKMNLSLEDIKGELLLISQFTLAADTSKGLRPSFSGSAEPGLAKELFDALVEKSRASGLKIETGQFAADMQVSLLNDGPVTFTLKT